MARRLAIAALLLVAPLRALAAPGGTEFVLILDNSSSMIDHSTISDSTGRVTQTLPANDPDRLCVLATEILSSLLGPDDQLTILNFLGPEVGRFKVLPSTYAAIREMTYDGPTFFSGPLNEASRILRASPRTQKILLLLTDGGPSPPDTINGADARRLLGLDQGPPPFDVVSLALGGDQPDVAAQQKDILGSIGEYDPVKTPLDVVAGFTKILARTLRSRPETGTLQRGGSVTFDVPRYVSEVLVSVVDAQRTGPFVAGLATDSGNATPRGDGDNGCSWILRTDSNPNLCKPPFHHFTTFREPHDPGRPTRWTLSLPDARGAADYGIILRYDLVAEIMQAPTTARMGDTVEVKARLTFHGKTFDDPGFFSADGFKASATLGGKSVELVRQQDATFFVRVPVEALGRLPLHVQFENRWLSLQASAPEVVVEGWLPLVLHATPAQLDFGSWTGDGAESRRCVTIDLTGSENADHVPLEVAAEQLPADMLLAPAGGAGARAMTMPISLHGTRATVCASLPGCCSSGDASAASAVLLRGVDPHYHAEALHLPVLAHAIKTPWLTCWWRVVVAVLAALLLLLVIYGYLSPYDFGAEESIRMARSEQAISRAIARRLRELPGGRRGFYRSAAVGFDGSGTNVTNRKVAVVMLTARKGETAVSVSGALERKDARTRQWTVVPPEELRDAIRRGQIYRVGDFHFKIG